ncbi:MAG: T9SS type A sorting domain-containing protein, partial [Ferruginibacter sp.]
GTQTAIGENDNLPRNFSLAQNYPNPFSSKTIIKFTLSEQENVVIKVYTVLGDEIKTIVDEEFTQGRHEVEFNAAGLSSGTYFYRFTSGSNTVFKKMQVL